MALTTPSSITVTTEVLPAVLLESPEFEARAHVGAKKLTELTAYAENLLKDSSFNALFFIRMIEKTGSQVPTLDAMLELVQARKTGELGKRVIDSRHHMARMNSDLPQIDPKFMKVFQDGRAKAEWIVRIVGHIFRQIEKALKSYQNMRELIDEDAAYIDNHAELMIEAVLQSENAANEQDSRSKELLVLSALLEILQEKLADRLDKIADGLKANPDDEELKDEQQRLASIVPLLVKRQSSLKPLTYMGNMNESRFLDIRNTDAVAAITLKDLAGPGIAQWKTDIVSQLMFMQAEISNMVAQTGIDVINEESQIAAEAYARHMGLFAQLMGKLIVSVETVQKASEAVVAAHEASEEALKKAIEVGKTASRAVEKGRNEVAKAEEQASEELRRLLRS